MEVDPDTKAYGGNTGDCEIGEGDCLKRRIRLRTPPPFWFSAKAGLLRVRV